MRIKRRTDESSITQFGLSDVNEGDGPEGMKVYLYPGNFGFWRITHGALPTISYGDF
jgi:hypothetical protein